MTGIRRCTGIAARRKWNGTDSDGVLKSVALHGSWHIAPEAVGDFLRAPSSPIQIERLFVRRHAHIALACDAGCRGQCNDCLQMTARECVTLVQHESDCSTGKCTGELLPK